MNDRVGPSRRIQPAILALLVAAAIACPPVPVRADEARPMNVVLILADDLGWSDVGCYGADLHETPNIDRLAGQGVRFTSAYTAPVCSPTRAALLTGKHYARLHMTIWFESSQAPPRDKPLNTPHTVGNLPHAETTIAERLRDAGYQTAIVGKWHLGDAGHYPQTQGFDINIGGTQWGAPQTFFYPYRGSRHFGGEPRYVPHLEWGQPGEYLTDRLSQEAVRVIERAGDKPFFLYLAHHSVHTPIEAKPEQVAHFQRKLSDKLRHQNATYAAMVQSLDQSVGRVLDCLDERGLADNTLVVFLSDNGGYVNQYEDRRVTDNWPLRSGKGSLYEGGVRVPLVVRWPGVTKPGTVCDEPVTCMDLFPTIARAAGIPFDESEVAALDGQDLTPLFKRPDATLPREALYFHYPHYYPTTTPVGAIRQRDWKLLEYFEDDRLELYNLRDDVGELKNLAAAHPQRAAQLRDLLHAWRKRVDAQMPTK